MYGFLPCFSTFCLLTFYRRTHNRIGMIAFKRIASFFKLFLVISSLHDIIDLSDKKWSSHRKKLDISIFRCYYICRRTQRVPKWFAVQWKTAQNILFSCGWKSSLGLLFHLTNNCYEIVKSSQRAEENYIGVSTNASFTAIQQTPFTIGWLKLVGYFTSQIRQINSTNSRLLLHQNKHKNTSCCNAKNYNRRVAFSNGKRQISQRPHGNKTIPERADSFHARIHQGKCYGSAGRGLLQGEEGGVQCAESWGWKGSAWLPPSR